LAARLGAGRGPGVAMFGLEIMWSPCVINILSSAGPSCLHGLLYYGSLEAADRPWLALSRRSWLVLGRRRPRDVHVHLHSRSEPRHSRQQLMMNSSIGRPCRVVAASRRRCGMLRASNRSNHDRNRTTAPHTDLSVIWCGDAARGGASSERTPKSPN